MKNKLLFIVNVDWFFLSHRLPIAIAALAEGYEVHIACQLTDKSEQLSRAGFILHPLPISRSGTALLDELKTFKATLALLLKLKPEIVHLVTIKPVLYGGIAARLAGVKRMVASISGLGYVFIAKGFRAGILRRCVSLMYRFALCSKGTSVIFQNPSDADLFTQLSIVSREQIVMIPGSGVCLDDYPVCPEPVDEPVVMLVARLLIDKGVQEFVQAARILRLRSFRCRMVLVGSTDENPKSVTAAELSAWVQDGIVEHWGYSTEVADTMAQANIITLPSYREGLPKSLIEAASCGRAVITTNVPGCRDAIQPNVTGLLVPVKDATALADAIEQLCSDTDRRLRMASAGRAWAEQTFDIKNVIAIHLTLYQKTE